MSSVQKNAPGAADAFSGFRAFGNFVRRRRSELAAALFDSQFGAHVFKRFPNDYAENAERRRVESRFLGPLLDLLAEYARTGDPIYRDLYLAERRRYAPHRQGAARPHEYFAFVLPRDERVLSTAVHGREAEALHRLRDLHRPLFTASQGARIRVLSIGDCLMTEIQAFLLARAMAHDLDLDVRYFYFSALLGMEIEQDGVASTITDEGVDVVAASYLSYDGIPLYRSLLQGAEHASAEETKSLVTGILGFMRSHLHQIRAATDAPILLHNASGLPLGRWQRLIPGRPPLSPGRRQALAQLNAHVAAPTAEIPNCLLLDEANVVARRGIRACARSVLPRRIRRHAEFHPTRFGQHLAQSYMDIIRASGRNEPASHLFASAGFVESEPGNWVLSPGQPVPGPEWIDGKSRRHFAADAEETRGCRPKSTRRSA